MSEFTGERVIPGLVDANLLNEHVARYRFAARFIREGASVLDAGCGAGYGSVEMARHARVTAIDISRENFDRPEVAFLQAACEALPFADGAFDLVTSFEVIEHLARWPELVAEACRVLKAPGVFLVSTPNKAYYEESRAKAGPNPFHCHEFEYSEFQAALESVFPHVRIWTQNHAESIVFAPIDPKQQALDAQGDAAPELAHFFFAACSQSPIAENEVFAWLPSTANVLREREHHIAKLEGELAKKDAWLTSLIGDHAKLKEEHDGALRDLEQRAAWTEKLNTEIAERRARIEVLQAENDTRLEWLREVEAEARGRLDWVHHLEAEIEAGGRNVERLEVLVSSLQTWGESLNDQFQEKAVQVQELWREVQDLRGLQPRLDEALRQLDLLQQQRALIASSRWVRLGRKLNIGPAIDGV